MRVEVARCRITDTHPAVETLTELLSALRLAIEDIRGLAQEGGCAATPIAEPLSAPAHGQDVLHHVMEHVRHLVGLP